MEEKVNFHDEKKSLAQSHWIWSIPTALIIYILSPGPVGFILLKFTPDDLNKWNKVFEIIYFPHVFVFKYQVPILCDLLNAYMKFWMLMAGGP